MSHKPSSPEDGRLNDFLREHYARERKLEAEAEAIAEHERNLADIAAGMTLGHDIAMHPPFDADGYYQARQIEIEKWQALIMQRFSLSSGLAPSVLRSQSSSYKSWAEIDAPSTDGTPSETLTTSLRPSPTPEK